MTYVIQHDVDSPLPDADSAKTYWESTDQWRWSRYLRGIEKDVLLRTLERFDCPGSAVEIGCDGGQWSQMLRERGWDLTCIDIDPAAIAVCQKRLPDAKVLLADPTWETYPIPSGAYDLVVCIQLPPAQDPWFACEAARLLRPGGILVFDVINASSYRSYLSKMRSLVRHDEMFYVQRFADVRGAYQRHGFRFLETIGHAWPPFSRDSDSRWIPVVTQLERLIGLRKLSRYAPWVISVAQLEENSNDPRGGHQQCES